MRTSNEGRLWWLGLGLFAGLAIAWLWPHEPAFATNSDRDQDFAIITVPVGNQAAGFVDPIDGVFILDFLTGQLRGAVLNRQTGAFHAFYVIDLTKEFGVDAAAKPRYAIASGNGQLNVQGGANIASGIIYIAELTTGKCLAYTFPWRDGNAKMATPLPLKRVAFFQWRQPKGDDS
ncbi:MAG: hypothetical protein EHM42_15640 [Planctomycetaceae bacterium]|nr:MAG: hypothetical protein EHM42_15640 [Planctomycetaceae bacterium]